MARFTKQTVDTTHRVLREILISYNNPEFGDCIVDDICRLFGFPTTISAEPIDAEVESSKADMFNLGEKYKSRVNNIAKGCEYEIVKKNKTTCWVKLWEDGVEKETIYKNILYSTFFPKNN